MSESLAFLVLLLLGIAIATGFLAVKKIYRIVFFLSLFNYAALAVFSFTGLRSLEILSITIPLIESNKALFGISFLLDGLGLTFIFAISVVGIFINLYTHHYFSTVTERARCLGLLHLFGIAMIGLVSSQNLLLLFIFWEMTTVISYLLISFNGESKKARNSAWRALITTVFGGLCLLTSFIFISMQMGSLDLQQLYSTAVTMREGRYTDVIVLLLLVGGFTKSAQFPFHFWLPGAMSAPTPVSAFLHSATMVKAGIFLIARLYPLFEGHPIWHLSLIAAGMVTAIWGILFAFEFKDLKQILAYTTISSLGYLMMLLGLGTQNSIKAALLYFLVHVLYKAGLFMSVGALDKLYKTRNVDELRRKKIKVPMIVVAIGLLSLSMMGVPPMLGFMAKELIYEAKLELGNYSAIITSIGVCINVLTVAVAGIFISILFGGKDGDVDVPAGRKTVYLMLGPMVFALISLFIGMFPDSVANLMLGPGIYSIIGQKLNIELKIWHGFTPLFYMSLFTLALGGIAFYFREYIHRLILWVNRFLPRATLVLDLFVQLMLLLSKIGTRLFYPPQHRSSLFLVLAVIGMITVYLNFQLVIPINLNLNLSYPDVIDGLLMIFIIIPLIYCLKSSHSLSIALAAGISGLGISLLYAIYGAIDVALTQIIVETFMVILLVFVIKKLPLGQRVYSYKGSFSTALLAFTLATTITMTIMFSSEIPLEQRDSLYMVKNSLEKAFGKNIVNVILVDFRAFDTFGEISVLMISMIGAFKLARVIGR